MLLIPCPNCGPRNSADLRYVGEAGSRPDPNASSPTAWRHHLYLENNPAGWVHETWYCRAGCRRYFVLERHTVTNEFRDPRVLDPEPAPSADAEGPT